jgi:hypothetical protein
VDWQQVIVNRHPGDFARGLFHSDGWRGVNQVGRPLSDGDHWYEYRRYLFVNESIDILGLCGETLDRLGVTWARSKPMRFGGYLGTEFRNITFTGERAAA